MRIAFDAGACVGHGRCYALAPQVFDADDEGHCVVLVGVDADVPEELCEGARSGAENCPENAITLIP